MAELNIDTMLVENQNVIQLEEKLVSFSNGCICCTLREDLLQEVAKLAREQKFDYLVIESTGISEPMQVAETFTFDLMGIDPAISQGTKELQELSRLDTCVTVVDCSSFLKYFKSKDIASEVFTDVDEADDRSIVQLLIDQIEFSNVILLNKCDLVTDEMKNEVKNTIKQLNRVAEIIETTKSNVDLTKVINTGLFDFNEAEQNAKWLVQDRYDIHPETEEFGVSSFLYNRSVPFHPKRLHTLLESNFMLDIVNPEDQAGHLHGDHDHEHANEGAEGEEDGEEEEDEDDETEEDYQKRLAEAKEKFKKEREVGGEKQEKGIFKHLFRSKGFFWLANRPNLFFEWGQAAMNHNISVGGPWVCTLKELPLEVQCQTKDFGDRAQNLIFIGQQMKLYKDAIIEALDKCLVTGEEWSCMMESKMTLEVEDDPFSQSVFPEDQGN